MRTNILDFSFNNIDNDSFKYIEFLDETSSKNLIKTLCAGNPILYTKDSGGYVLFSAFIALKNVSYQQYLLSYELQNSLNRQYFYKDYNFICNEKEFKKIKKQSDIPISLVFEKLYTYDGVIAYYQLIKHSFPNADIQCTLFEPSFTKYIIYKIGHNIHFDDKHNIFITFDEINNKIFYIHQDDIGNHRIFFNHTKYSKIINDFKKQFKDLNKIIDNL